MIDIASMTVAQIKTLVRDHRPLDEEILMALEHDPRSGVRKLAEGEFRRVQRDRIEARRMEKLLRHERRLWRRGVQHIAGVDEAGRGPLAGPVVAAAVVLPQQIDFPGLDDSKKLSPQKREILYDLIAKQAFAVGVGRVDHQEIDRINILQASLKAMREALAALKIRPDRVLVDGSHTPNSPFPEVAISGGDAQSLSIAAASVIAKVTRDRIMVELDRDFPQYGFAKHKGYGSPEHLRALRKYGPCPIHRRSFRTVGDLIHKWSEDFLVFRKGLSEARSIAELQSLAHTIRSVRTVLPEREVAELRRNYKKREAALLKTGHKGEDLAVQHLEQKGFTILAQGYRAAGGEIDIIAQKDKTLTFVEVKTDATGSFGPPETWVDRRKQGQIAKVAARYLQHHEPDDVDFRFDVIAVSLQKGKRRIEHIEDAFWVEEALG